MWGWGERSTGISSAPGSVARLILFADGCFSADKPAPSTGLYAHRILRPRRRPAEERLRHDVDVHITKVQQVGRIEAELGAVATYYVPLTLPFNQFYPENAAILRELVALGEIAGVMPRTICMHNPSLRGEDRFRAVDGYVHPHDPRHADGLRYVSDSCRAWRDEELLRCFGEDPPCRLLLNTHPEFWLGMAGEGREQFPEGTLLENTLEQQRAYVLEEVHPAWRERAGPAAESAPIKSPGA
jgi:hypothetical protein